MRTVKCADSDVGVSILPFWIELEVGRTYSIVGCFPLSHNANRTCQSMPVQARLFQLMRLHRRPLPILLPRATASGMPVHLSPAALALADDHDDRIASASGTMSGTSTNFQVESSASAREAAQSMCLPVNQVESLAWSGNILRRRHTDSGVGTSSSTSSYELQLEVEAAERMPVAA